MSLKKVLLMGKSGAGKTSMRSIIFANYLARDTMRLCPTIDVEHSHVRFLGNLVLNLWDCGGQEDFVENYFQSQRDHIFRNVQVLIYVFDIESHELQKDMHYFTSCLEALQHNSANAKIFVMVHKMDMLPEERREPVFRQREADLKKIAAGIGKMDVHCFQTSIWDETLYKVTAAAPTCGPRSPLAVCRPARAQGAAAVRRRGRAALTGASASRPRYAAPRRRGPRWCTPSCQTLGC